MSIWTIALGLLVLLLLPRILLGRTPQEAEVEEEETPRRLSRQPGFRRDRRSGHPSPLWDLRR